MRQTHLRPTSPGLLAALVLALAPAAGSGQQPKPVKVHFFSVDRVDLRGFFYPSKKGKDAPCVLMLHQLGGNCKEKGWEALALKLQAKGFAVLTFDFRGHGESKKFDRDFWSIRENQQGIRRASKSRVPSKLDFKSFNRGYLPYLVNDVAAAKAFLDMKNDQGECNSQNLVLIGAKEGAVIGALWMKEERHRFRFDPVRATVDKTPEVKDVFATVWLSFTTKFGGSRVNTVKLFKRTRREKVIPTVFVFGDKDVGGKKLAKYIAYKLIRPSKEEKDKTVGLKTIKGGDTLKGRQLLQKSLGTDDFIADWLNDLVEKTELNAHERRKFKDQDYIWILPNGRRVIAKTARDTTLKYIPIPFWM
jgi:hypothetical protein